jgi:hypothetical protein
MLVPFTWLDDPQRALLWANAFNAALTVAVISLVMRLLGVPAAPLFALLAVTAGSEVPYRFMMLRAQNIAVVYMMVSVWAMARRRYVVLGVVAFLFLESYHAAVILGPLALIGAAALCYTERRVVVTPLVAVAAGMTLALVISPWYPKNLEYVMFHTLFKTQHSVTGEHLSALVGTEWYPPGWKNILRQCWPAHLMLAAALAALAWRRRGERAFRPGADTLIAAGTALLSLALYHEAVRFAEYYVPFAALAAGLAARDCAVPLRRRWLGPAVLAVWLVAAASVGLVRLERLQLMPADYMAAIGARLNQLGRPGDVVFNTSWSDFMALVWWADAFRYINGLDGHYLAYGDPARFVAWFAVGNGLVADPVTVIEYGFKARLVVVARQHPALAKQLMHSPRARLQLATRDGWLFSLAP